MNNHSNYYNMHTHEIVFMVSLTIISILWVRIFRQLVLSEIESKAYNAIEKYSAEQKNIDGTFLYINSSWLSFSRKREASMVFYTTKEFRKQQHPSITAHQSDTPHEDIIPDMTKSRYSTWSNEYNYDAIKREPVPFIYNDTGVLWEEKMGVDFLRDGWYEDLVDIQTRIYNNVTKYFCCVYSIVGISMKS